MWMKRRVDSASNQEGKNAIQQVRQRIRLEWRDLWKQRIEDKLTAEDVASKNYELLFVDKGTVIKASRDYKPPNLKEIMERNEKVLNIRLIYPDRHVGGWRKFSREVLSKQPRWQRVRTRTSRKERDKP